MTDPSSDEGVFGAAGLVADGRATVRDAPAKPRTGECVCDNFPGIRFSPAELQRARNRLSDGDGLHRLLARIGGDEARDARLPMPAHFVAPGFVRRHRGTLAVVALYALLVVVPGFLISAGGDRLGGAPFVKLTDWRELPGALFLYLVLAPVLWTFYLWQPRLIVDVFAGLAEGGVVGAPRNAGTTPDEFLRGVGATLPHAPRAIGPFRPTRGAWLAALAAVVSVATLVVWPPTALPPFDRLFSETDRYWWDAVPAYFWAIWLPLIFVNVYMLVWIVMRQTMMIANIQRLLRLFAVEPVPFHPDRCSGFAPIGSYATDIVRVALIVGGWALVLLLSGPITDHNPYVAPHTLFLVLVQVLLTPYLLLGPVWYAHRAMRGAHDRALQRVADRIRGQFLRGIDAPPAQPAAYRELEAEYRLAEEGYHTWPFRRGALGGVSLTAGITLIVNVAAIMYRLLTTS
jgi:hypothetical protein